MARILTNHDEIRAWAGARGGSPMLLDVPDPGTDDQQLLQLTFGEHALDADTNEGPDLLGGFTLVGWDEWLAALDAQGLGLKVNDEIPGVLDNDFEFVARGGHGRTTSAAQQPAPGTVERPRADGVRGGGR
jgi:hypothetical protein